MDRIVELLNKHLYDTLTPDEKLELLQYVKSGIFDETIKEKIAEHWEQDSLNSTFPQEKIPVVMNKILFAEQETSALLYKTAGKSSQSRLRLLVAAATLLFLCTLGYLYVKYSSPKPTVVARSEKMPDKAPGKPGAVLTLADGSSISLDSTHNGQITQQHNTRIIKQSGVLAYEKLPENNDTAIVWNTISTPRGSHYELVLPDGTHVWLNSATTLRYPVNFPPKAERLVMLNGEAYFETAADENKPFKVAILTNRLEKAAVKALGTSFNIMAYADESAIRTTLIEGAVIVSLSDTHKKLMPGQQAIFPQAVDGGIYIEQTDTEVAIAWKKGFFRFDQCKLPMIMRQISRWYDVDVTYENKVPDIVFGGGIDKNLPLSSILNTLQQHGIHFDFNGRNLVVKDN